MGVFAGFKPKRKVSAADEEVLSEAQIRGLIAEYSGQWAPPVTAFEAPAEAGETSDGQ